MSAPFFNPALRYLSVCSGIEAASVAWEPLGWTPVAFAEIERFPSRVLSTRWPHVANLGDFTAIDPAALGPVDLLVGGTPCQAFSVAGRRGSLADARGNLTLAFVDLAHGLADRAGCRWALWENVPGVLSTPDNAFGCFLGRLVGGDGPVVPPGAKGWGPHPHFDGERYDVHRTYRFQSCSWPRHGMVSGPRARAAWRVLDAQWFGLAQRRERVFVVVGLGDGTDPAAVLFERQGVRRHPPARGEAGQGVAGSLAASLGGCDENDAADGRLIAFGGNDTRGPIDVSTALNAHGGPCGRQDFESETFVVAPPTMPLCFDPRQADVLVHGDKTGPIDTKFPGPAIAFQDRFRGDDGRGYDRPPAISYDATGTLDTVKPWHVAFSISADAIDRSGEGAGGTAAERSGLGIEAELAHTLKAQRPNAVATAWAVRRLTPTECHRLQGFPDDHAALDCAADGPIYKALGNSKAVPVVRWIGARIALADAASTLPLLDPAECPP